MVVHFNYKTEFHLVRNVSCNKYTVRIYFIINSKLCHNVAKQFCQNYVIKIDS
jgi:hypothetical protein